MKKRILFTILASSLFCISLTSCISEPEKPEDEPETSRKILEASLDNRVIEIDGSTTIKCNVEGVTYKSSDENIATVNANGKIVGVEGGMAHITISKTGYYDKVLKVFVDDPETVDYLVEGFEFGPAIVGVKLNLPDKVNQSDLSVDKFTVRTNNGNRTITSIQLCDEEGEIINATESKYVRFNLSCSYSGWGVENAAQCFTYANNVNNWKANITASVALKSGQSLTAGETVYNNGKTFSRIRSRISLSTRDWGAAKSHTSDGQTLTYKAFETDEMRADGVLNPLIIWVHGMGEGGTDPDIALLGNDVTGLGETSIQSRFKKGKQAGAYVLSVQTPTMWMNNGTGGTSGGGNSIYRLTLKSTIDKFIEDNGDIDTNRIFFGGCSNGGYMTMEMAINYGDFFRAYYPCCEAYRDSFITDEQINKLKDLSIWFIHAANDTTVSPASYVIPTYQRIMAAGAKDCHFSYFTNVTGTDCNASGVNNYMGHYSWIYIFRDEVQFDQLDPEHVAAPSSEDVMVDNHVVNLFDWMESKK